MRLVTYGFLEAVEVGMGGGGGEVVVGDLGGAGVGIDPVLGVSVCEGKDGAVVVQVRGVIDPDVAGVDHDEGVYVDAAEVELFDEDVGSAGIADGVEFFDGDLRAPHFTVHVVIDG